MDVRFLQAAASFDGHVAVRPISVSLTERRIGIIGLNGSGKTTFARMINGLVQPSQGSVSINGLNTAQDGESVRSQVGFIFQNPQNQIILPILREDIELGLRAKKLMRAEVKAKVDGVLSRFGIKHLADRRVHELSGGELQLAALASVLVTEPALVILDEPTNQLDLRNRLLVQKTIDRLEEDVLVISHDLELVETFDRVLLFHEGQILMDGLPANAIRRYREIAGA
ncbi:putative enzyme [Pseudorhizobium banfieldiae]|uniref:Putative enzyme n=1 Tax=Pseudorhizobium banfieldiae TaxID=1125847 RepID=L0NBG4_9HYPH|nr:energy-coupling factor ABC transporter ATP-binding protein [Pseudorhizobium banfieldiae]CAD6601543.1 cobalt ABC transporter ATP-binding protein [arsenite-oxidising bacterium NT-25]CAD6606073.1 cobalt ABC transporter ATP-binding protein [Rhizobium sp. TCK]CCF18219.1 putative enzyme [Pseudorhizobium banfieldiae]